MALTPEQLKMQASASATGPDPSAIFGGQKIPPSATASPDPFSDYNVADAYKKSNFYDDSMQSQGYLDFLEDSRDKFMRSDMQQYMKSAAYNDARGKIFDAYETFNPIINQADQEAYMTQNPATIGMANVRKYDDGFFSPAERLPGGGLLPSMNPFEDPNYRPTYSGSMIGGADNPYSSLINDYMQSDYFDRSPFENAPNILAQYSVNDPIFGQITGGYNPYDTQGFSDFLENSYGDMQDRMQMRDVKSQEFMDKFNTYGDAYNLRFPGENPGMPDFITGGNGQLPGPIVDPNINPFDPINPMPGFNFEGGPAPKPSDYGNDFFNPDPRTLEEVKLMPGFNIGGPAPLEPGQKPNTTDIFGAGNNPINTPIAPMPSPVTPPPGMSSGHSHDDLLSGIGKLFEQYFPQRGGTSTPSATQPVFDAVGNSAPAQQTSPQVFGNMITPFGRQG